jgi:two-component system response regulator NreC
VGYWVFFVAGRQGEPGLNELPEPVVHVALVDDQTIFREGLRALIDQEPDFEVVAQAMDVHELEGLDPAPDVVVTDLLLSDVPRDEVIGRLRNRFPDAAVVALTALDDLPTVQEALAAGADGYVLKSAAKADLFAGIRTVARGGLYLQPSIGIAFASRPPEDLSRPAVGGLTPKETEVLRLLALGHTNAEVARHLGASLRTIETHRAHIHQKLDRHSRAQLVRFALDAGLLRLDAEGEPAPERRAVPREAGVIPT